MHKKTLAPVVILFAVLAFAIPALAETVVITDSFDDEEKYNACWIDTEAASIDSGSLVFNQAGELQLRAYNNIADLSAEVYIKGVDARPRGGFIIRKSSDTYYTALLTQRADGNYVLRIAKYIDGEEVDRVENYAFPRENTFHKLKVTAIGNVIVMEMDDFITIIYDDVVPGAGKFYLASLQGGVVMDNFSLTVYSTEAEDMEVTAGNWQYLFLSPLPADRYSRSELESMSSEAFSSLMKRVISEWENVRVGITDKYAEGVSISRVYP